MRPTTDIHDFDFLHGRWAVHNRRRLRRGVGDDRWDEFDATSTCTGHLGGMVNVDEIAFASRDFSGFTLRVLDLSAAQWSIWWVNSERGRLEPPVVGGFSGAGADGTRRGVFIGDDTDVDGDGRVRPVRARFVWTVGGADSCRWEQSFHYVGADQSDDGWELNWAMDLTRVA